MLNRSTLKWSILLTRLAYCFYILYRLAKIFFSWSFWKIERIKRSLVSSEISCFLSELSLLKPVIVLPSLGNIMSARKQPRSENTKHSSFHIWATNIPLDRCRKKLYSNRAFAFCGLEKNFHKFYDSESQKERIQDLKVGAKIYIKILIALIALRRSIVVGFILLLNKRLILCLRGDCWVSQFRIRVKKLDVQLP